MDEIVRIEKLNYVYADGSKALADVSLGIRRGESVGLVGPNGAGKSTLLLHLNGILRGEGSVRIFGKETVSENLEFIRRKVGMVFQDPEDQLFMPTVFDDVAFGPVNMGMPPEKVKTAVKNALFTVEMEGSAERVSHHLSFGEKQKISFATVLSMDPEILALDEPSSNLDPRARRHLIELLRNISVTRIVSGHDLELILETCRRVIVMDSGKIVADGEAKTILGNRSIMEAHGLEVPLSLRLKTVV